MQLEIEFAALEGGGAVTFPSQVMEPGRPELCGGSSHIRRSPLVILGLSAVGSAGKGLRKERGRRTPTDPGFRVFGP